MVCDFVSSLPLAAERISHNPGSLVNTDPVKQQDIFFFKHVAVDVDGLGTFDLVWLARGSLDRGDLDQAVRYVSMLK